MKRLISFIFIFVVCSFAYGNKTNYLINDICNITIEDKLELRSSDDIYTRFMKDSLGISSHDNTVFQQKGLAKKNKDALNLYCRMIIRAVNYGNGDFPACNYGSFTKDELNELKETAYDELALNQSMVQKPTVSIEATSKGYKYVKIEYIRTGLSDKGNVCVCICYFFNYNQAAKIVYSYRQSEKDLWFDTLENAIVSFNWKHPFYTQDFAANENPDTMVEPSYQSNDFLHGIVWGAIVMFVTCILGFTLHNHNREIKRKNIKEKFVAIQKLVDQNKIDSAKKLLTQTYPQIPQNDAELHVIYKHTNTLIVEKEKKVENEISNILYEIVQQADKGEIEKSYRLIQEANQKIQIEISSSLKEKTKEIVQSINERYERGIIPNQRLSKVLYSVPDYFKQNKGYYLRLAFPTYNAIVFPYRRKKTELRGYSELSFQQKLNIAFSDMDNYKILGDVSILPSEGCHPYEPDIAIIEKIDKIGLRIDVEIDEPYSGYSRTPIHYIGCGDEYRDIALANIGWITIRFSEQQIVKEAPECISFLKYLISILDSSIGERQYKQPLPDKQWSLVEAQIMAVQNYREKLLHHQFGYRDTPEISNEDITQTNLEKEATRQVKPLKLQPKENFNIDNSALHFNDDDLIAFEPNEHVYIYKGILELQPVSNIISSYFQPFDTLRLSAKVAKRKSKNQCEIIEEWDCKGEESRTVGIFLHSQIEKYFNNQNVCNSTHFTYNGEYIKISKDISISIELQYFMKFLSENQLVPFRTEWHIYDLEKKIAGTIDLLCRNGESFDIYDWKRSHRAGPEEIIWNYGINELSHIPDISFYHYALQQNLYKYILEKNYGIQIKNMYIVVLCADYNNYHKYKIPNLSAEIQSIINNLH